MKLDLRKGKLGFWGVVLIAAALLAVTSQAYAFRFVVMADSPDNETNQTGFNKNALEYLRDRILDLSPQPDMVFFLGDLVTMTHDTQGHAYLPDWKETMTPLAQAGIKIYVSVGNRDLYPADVAKETKDLEEEFRTMFSDPPYFDMPSDGPASPYNYQKLAYTVSAKNVFFVVLDTFAFKADSGANWNNGLDSQQLSWLDSQVSQATQKYKFVLSHGPAYSPEGGTIDPSVQQQMWGILQAHNVDAYFCGHEHIYSRWKIDKKVDPSITTDITQIITGAGGALPDQIFKVTEDRKAVHAASLYNFVVGDVTGEGVRFRTFGIDQNAGKYSSKIIDQFTLK